MDVACRFGECGAAPRPGSATLECWLSGGCLILASGGLFMAGGGCRIRASGGCPIGASAGCLIRASGGVSNVAAAHARPAETFLPHAHLAARERHQVRARAATPRKLQPRRDGADATQGARQLCRQHVRDQLLRRFRRS
eukprot:5597516-Prymnesium_polylepis.1